MIKFFLNKIISLMHDVIINLVFIIRYLLFAVWSPWPFWLYSGRDVNAVLWLAEHHRVTDKYVRGACDARRTSQTNMTSCDDVSYSGARDSVLQFPVIVPCSFVPLKRRYVDGKIGYH